jgi:hypothetical protein
MYNRCKLKDIGLEGKEVSLLLSMQLPREKGCVCIFMPQKPTRSKSR